MKNNYLNRTKDFYNNWDKDLVSKYLIDNPRLREAIIFVLKSIPSNAQNVFDFGCGIGWSSHECARHFPETKITGYDIGAKLIETAKKLFTSNNLSYKAENLLEDHYKKEKSADVVLMLDVFEHIPESGRKTFYKRVNDILKDNGMVILTCPTPEYQNYLREFEPETLQPTDENVSKEVLEDFARNIGGKLTHYDSRSIWREKDYFHAILQKGRQNSVQRRLIKLEGILRRRQRVKQKLGFTISYWQTIKTLLRTLK